jgi:ubiquitin-protein ligase
MRIREKRLRNDFQTLSELVASSNQKLTIVSSTGNPPHIYVIEYQCQGIEKIQNNLPVFRNVHRVEIILGINYPIQQPNAKFLTPIFHPNVYPNLHICLGSHWKMTEPLSELVLRIGKIIQYAEDITNLKSPANNAAKLWALNYKKKFPIDTQTFKSGTDVAIAWEEINHR